MDKIKFTMRRQNNQVGVFIVYPDGTINQIALYEVPNDNNWRADVEFYDGLVDVYKKRFNKIC